jgi:hypothetical protein
MVTITYRQQTLVHSVIKPASQPQPYVVQLLLHVPQAKILFFG